MKKGFTLIELLIVITIIGILAVVFLPSIMSAPAKARDAARKADLSTIIESIEAYRLDNAIRVGQSCIDDALDPTTNPGIETYFPGGKIPHDPSGLGAGACSDDYLITYRLRGGDYKYVVGAQLEVEGSGNLDCAEVPGEESPLPSLAGTGDCYVLYQR